MSAATIADLVGAMRAACVATEIEATLVKRTWSPELRARNPDQRLAIGLRLLDEGSAPPKLRMIPTGANAKRCYGMTALWAAGWQILPIPAFQESSEAFAPRLSWSGRIEWVAVPPEESGLKARRFKGQAAAQLWASESLAKAGEALRQHALTARATRKAA